MLRKLNFLILVCDITHDLFNNIPMRMLIINYNMYYDLDLSLINLTYLNTYLITYLDLQLTQIYGILPLLYPAMVIIPFRENFN